MKKLLIASILLACFAVFPLAAVCESDGEGARYDSAYGFSIEYSETDWVLIDARSLSSATEGEAALADIGAEAAELMSAYANGAEAVFLFLKHGEPGESVSIMRQSGVAGVTTERLMALEAGIQAQYKIVYGDAVSFPAPAEIVKVGENEFMRVEALITLDGDNLSVVQLMLTRGDYIYSVTYTYLSQNEQTRAYILEVLNTFTLTDE